MFGTTSGPFVRIQRVAPPFFRTRARTVKLDWLRTVVALLLVLFGVFMMRWNVVIGGQAFSLSFAGYMHYHIPIIPHSLETFKEGLFGALTVIITPFVLFWLINKFVPSLRSDIGEA